MKNQFKNLLGENTSLRNKQFLSYVQCATSKICRKIPILKYLFEVLFRLRIAKTFDKNAFQHEGNVFKHIYRENMWDNSESRSGVGSEISATITIRKTLPLLWEKFNVRTFLDVPCGDFNWMNVVDKTGIEYIGGDVVEEIVKKNNEQYGAPLIRFEKIDITTDVLPKADMIFCKDCLQHLSYENIFRALYNFKQSGAKYLMVTSYPLTLRNHDILDGDYRALNLLKKPFSLPRNYIFRVREKSDKEELEIDKTKYLWKLSDILNN